MKRRTVLEWVFSGQLRDGAHMFPWDQPHADDKHGREFILRLRLDPERRPPDSRPNASRCPMGSRSTDHLDIHCFAGRRCGCRYQIRVFSGAGTGFTNIDTRTGHSAIQAIDMEWVGTGLRDNSHICLEQVQGKASPVAGKFAVPSAITEILDCIASHIELHVALPKMFGLALCTCPEHRIC